MINLTVARVIYLTSDNSLRCLTEAYIYLLIIVRHEETKSLSLIVTQITQMQIMKMIRFCQSTYQESPYDSLFVITRNPQITNSILIHLMGTEKSIF